jgi:hypothetical protein
MNTKKSGMILEALKYVRSVDELYTDDMVGDILGEQVEFEPLWGERNMYIEALDEAKAVTFGNKTYPKQGWAVVMAGGAGSGKGTTIEKQILINAKILDVDAMKVVFSKISAGKGYKVSQPISQTSTIVTPKANTQISKLTGGREYDFKNTNDVMDLHATIGTELELDKKREATLLQSIKTGSGFLTNLIFDITGKTSTKLMNIATTVKKLGYHTSLVWVVTNRQVALMRNLLRDRVVDQRLFHEIHNQVNEVLLDFLQSKDARSYDEAWIVFSGDSKVSDLPPAESRVLFNNSVYKLKKTGDSFEVPEDLAKKIIEFLGPKEVDPRAPKIYKDYEEIKTDISPYVGDDGKAKGYKDLSFMK